MGMPFDDAERRFKDAERHARADGDNPVKEIAQGLEQLTIALRSDINALYEKLAEIEDKLK